MSSSNDDIESDEDVSIYDVTDNRNLFQKMIKLCRKNRHCPHKLVEDMSKMYECCSDKQKNSRKLCNFILKGIKNISVENKNSFDYAADVYNELLQLSKKDSSNSQNENCIASTSNGIKSIAEFENEDNETKEIFKRLIEKCYQNPNFPNENIEKIDKLYNSLPSEFISSKYFSRLLKEADLSIWPDTTSSSYIHIEHVYEQLLLFQSSMMCQDKMSIENKEINQKKLKKLAVLKKALHFARKKIKTLNESEMDINNDDDFGSDSLYILKDKYEKRVIQIYKRMCKLRDEPDYLEQPPLRFNETNNVLVNKAVEKFYNINKQFPDYFEIYSLLKLLNEKKKLNWTKSELQNISHTAFLKLGKRLKANRLNEYFGDLATVTNEEDPAENNEVLRNKLEESNKKLLADLTKVRDEFINKQDYAGETGSSLNNSECELSSEDEYIEENFNKNSKCIKSISIKRKRQSSYTSEDEKFPKKSKKTIYMESFDLIPNTIGGNSSIDKTDKNTVDVNNDNIDILDTTINVNDVEAPNNTSTVSENINNCKENDNNISVEEGSICGTEGDGTLVIDEDHDDDELVSKNSHENKVQSAKIKDNSMQISTVTVDNKSSDPIASEPIVVINDNSVIELNDLDDSDVEITSCDTSRVPVQNKKSLENIIKSMNFDKKYKFGQNQQSIRHPSINFPSRGGHNVSNINRSSTDFVNHWVANNTRPSRPIYNKRENYGRTHPIIRQHSTSHNMQSSIQKNIQTARHFNQRYSNSHQQRHFPNNQSLLQQCVTTMTTTTTVRQVVRQSSKNIQRVNQPITQSDSHSQPELIELD